MTDAERILADRLALALMSQSELMQAIVLCAGRGKDRNMLREDPGYAICRRMVKRVLRAELMKLEKKEAA